MTLDEAIKHAEEVAIEEDKLCKRYDDASGYTRSHNEEIRTSYAKKCEKCATEHRQLVDWLKDYKKLLEQEPCEDAISRQAAQAKIRSICDKYRLSYEDGERKAATGGSAYALGHAFDDLPPVTLQPKTGHWIEHNAKSYECSECHNAKSLYASYKTDYCHDCGVKMFEPQESEVEE